MRSFILLERPEDKRRNRLVIAGFIVFTIVISYIIYGSVSYGLSKINAISYNDYSDSAPEGAVYPVHMNKIKVSCAENDFRTYVANTDSDKERGLSVFRKIADNMGMIFVFDSPKKYTFWMKGMKFPIDIVWLDENGTIVDIKQNIAVNTYPDKSSPKIDSLYALELNSGVTDRMKIKIGDVCNFDFYSLK